MHVATFGIDWPTHALAPDQAPYIPCFLNSFLDLGWGGGEAPSIG